MDDAAHAAERFARLLAAARWDDLAALLAPDVAFSGMTPSRFWEATGAGDVVTGVLRAWIEDTDHVEALLDVATEAVADRRWLRYRLRVRNDDGLFLVDQSGYLDVGADGRITRLHLVCAGFHPLAAGPSVRAP